MPGSSGLDGRPGWLDARPTPSFGRCSSMGLDGHPTPASVGFCTASFDARPTAGEDVGGRPTLDSRPKELNKVTVVQVSRNMST